MKKHAILIRTICGCLLSLSVMGCATTLSLYQDRKRAIIYTAPQSFHPYSKPLVQELGYTTQWNIPLADLTNVDVSSVEIQDVSDQSLIVSMNEQPLTGDRSTHFLVTGAQTTTPRVIKKSFPGAILPVDGKIYAVEANQTGFILSGYDDQLNQVSKKNIVLYKLRNVTKNDLDSSDTGNLHAEDNISSYFVSYPYVVFTSVNYVTDKYYRSTRFQSQSVTSNTVAFICVNLLTGETLKTQEADYGVYYHDTYKANPRGIFTPSAGRFYVVQDGDAFVFTLTNDQNEYLSGYFRKDTQEDATLYADTAENIVKMFPTLALETHVQAGNAKSLRILDQAISAGTLLNLEGVDREVIAYRQRSDQGFLIYTREGSSDSSRCTVYYTDPTLETVNWKHEFAPGVVVTSGTFSAEGDTILLPDCDSSGGGMFVGKVFATGAEAKALPVNLYQTKYDAATEGFAFFGPGIVLYDDQTSSVSLLTQSK